METEVVFLQMRVADMCCYRSTKCWLSHQWLLETYTKALWKLCWYCELLCSYVLCKFPSVKKAFVIFLLYHCSCHLPLPVTQLLPQPQLWVFSGKVCYITRCTVNNYR